MGKKKNNPEYVVICREFNRPAAKIEISVIDSGVTDDLLKKLIRLRHIDTHRRYFLTTKKYYQKYGAVMKKQVETMSFHGNRNIVELGAELDKERGKMKETKIDWAESTWNPVTGCNHDCPYCYARNIARRFSGGGALKYGARAVLNDPVIIDGKRAAYPYGFKPTFHRYRLKEYRETKGRNIFVCSMADLFGAWVPDGWIKEVFDECLAAPQHNYLFLTKNPERYIELAKKGLLPSDDNFWYGSSVTGPKDIYTWFSKDYHWFLSVEPILDDLGKMDPDAQKPEWIIVGAETGRRAGKVVPAPEWIEKIRFQCAHYDIPLFMKSSLAGIYPVPLIQEFPEKLNRKEE